MKLIQSSLGLLLNAKRVGRMTQKPTAKLDRVDERLILAYRAAIARARLDASRLQHRARYLCSQNGWRNVARPWMAVRTAKSATVKVLL